MALSKVQANMTENVLRTDVTDQVLSPDTVIKNAGLDDNFPAGMIVLFVNDQQFADASSGWVACDGAAVSKSSYPDLYAVIGGEFGETPTTFTLPGLTTPAEIVGFSLGGGYGIRAKNRTKA